MTPYAKALLAGLCLTFGYSSTAHAEKVSATKPTSGECPAFLNAEFRKLHSKETINLCSLYNGKPILFVNTASHCGFTPQFKALEGLYQKYKEQGLQVVGFSSNDFKQAAKDEEKAAGICYKNYGVTFTMIAPSKVTGEGANSTFVYLASQTKQPAWNFNKYLFLGAQNTVPQATKAAQVLHFDSKVEPLDSDLEEEVKKWVF